jgi:cell wall-associated NlpC family hydrolase
MHYGICNLSIVPLRIEPCDKSEQVSQLLFGEHFKVLEIRRKWSKIRLSFDNYEGWIDNNQYEKIEEETYTNLEESNITLAGELIEFATDKNQNFLTVTIGSNLPHYNNQNFLLNNTNYHYEGIVFNKKLPKDSIVEIAYKFLNTSYLWGGKTPFGIDCSGFTQLVYKLCGYKLLREASQQASQGEVLSFIEESEAGDLAFFDDNEGIITHVGIIMNDNYIIHAHGKVRIDRIDHSGIFNIDSQKHTHKLRVIKKII